MWEWIRCKIDKKLAKWNRNFLSLVGRYQVCQKILSSFNIYFYSTWLFCNYQFNHIMKQIRNFLWSDGKGNRKYHVVKWDWCVMNKSRGGMGLKDLKIQDIALASKWICRALEGDEPWKVLIRNNIQMFVPKYAKRWKNLPLGNLLLGKFVVSPYGSEVFKSLWKAWAAISQHLTKTDFCITKGQIAANRSIWWNTLHKDKLLATLQGCSALKWFNYSIRNFEDIFSNRTLISWDDLSYTFNVPPSQYKIYSVLKDALSPFCLQSPLALSVSSPLSFCWANNSPLPLLKAKTVYNTLVDSDLVIDHLNLTWNLDWKRDLWAKSLGKFWTGHSEPKKKCFGWQLFLHKLSLKDSEGIHFICKTCRLPKTVSH